MGSKAKPSPLSDNDYDTATPERYNPLP
ncbi:hypothetical protein A2U01_0036577, partial [Trifolium medium]|nr:hypothetical protein [Trifolium medium]